MSKPLTKPMIVGAQQEGFEHREIYSGTGNRHVVVLKRGRDEWHIIVNDAANDDDAKDWALRHANGYEDQMSNQPIPPSNGPAGWKFVRFDDMTPMEKEAGMEFGVNLPEHWQRKGKK